MDGLWNLETREPVVESGLSRSDQRGERLVWRTYIDVQKHDAKMMRSQSKQTMDSVNFGSGADDPAGWTSGPYWSGNKHFCGFHANAS